MQFGMPIEKPQIRRHTCPVTVKPQLRSAMATAVAASIAAAPPIKLRLRASWDTNPGPKPPRFTRALKPPRPSAPPSPPPAAARTAVLEKEDVLPLSQLLTLDRIRAERETGKTDEQYMGHERWLPVAPKVKKPRSIYNAASLAYMGDCIYELYARRHFLFPPSSINDYNERVMKVVRCEAQDLLLKKLLNEDYLTVEERDVLRWGKNIATNKTRTTKRAGVAVYNRASSLETLIGYLYLTDVKRLEGLMHQLGFSTGASQLVAEDLRMNFRKQPVESGSPDSL